MTTLINVKDYGKIRALFSALEKFQPMCAAVLDGIWPGKIWVNDIRNPQSALLITFLGGGGAAWCFLAGEADARFSEFLNNALFEEKVAGDEVGMFLFTPSSENWVEQLETIGAPRQPITMLRQHYVCRKLMIDHVQNLPDAYNILPMGTSMIERDDLEIPTQVKTTLEKWMTVKDERFQDYGYVVVHKNQVVAWATVDFVTSLSGDLGFETLPEFQQRGLGSMVAAAALERGIEKGLEIHWTCTVDNIGSQKTAQKLGLECDREYSVHLFALDVWEHLAQLGYSFLSRGEYRHAIECYEQLFTEKDDIASWAYFDTAQAWAGLGESEKAISYLRQAAENGWTDVSVTEQTPEFEVLHNLPEWKSVLDEIRKNHK